ncbi:MAG: NAD(P)-dependent alcohol dehydrogenase, partial [Oleiharenicola lentus]
MPKPTCYSTKAFAATSPTSPLAPITIERRDPGTTDVQIQIL